MRRKIEMDMIELAKILRISAYNLHGCALMATHCQKGKEAWDTIRNLTPGDLVVEVSTIWLRQLDINAVGKLESITMEPVDFGDPEFVWDEEIEGRPHPLEKVFNIITLDGRPYRWTNAMFIKIPDFILR